MVTGGQSGADFGGLLGAEKAQIPTSGYAPKGFLTEKGPNLDLRDAFGLMESDSDDYATRTRQNVEIADAVLVFARNFESAGTKLTKKLCFELGKPVFGVQFSEKASFIGFQWFQDCQLWLQTINPVVLMVAGNRESVAPGIEKWVENAIPKLFEHQKRIDIAL